jgi:hypothetical protein
MRMPGFTAEVALGPSVHKYRRLNSADITSAQVITPQAFEVDCSKDGHLCYFCDDQDGGSPICDWFWDGHYLVTTVSEA